jgi:ribosomal-protein-alanine N-acetyltransferase
VIASIAPDNDPSLAIVRKLGFEQTGEQWDDEDGLELVFQLELR